MSSIQEQTSEQDKDFGTVIGVKMSLNLSSAQLTASAKKLLQDHFTNQSSSAVPLFSSKMQYSRRDLLTLATSPLVREAPLNWDSLVHSIDIESKSNELDSMESEILRNLLLQ